MSTPDDQRADVIVIGGGVAGLAAATRAGRARRPRHRRRGAARASAAARAPTPTRRRARLVDNGQHILMGCYRESFAFLRRIGAHVARARAAVARRAVDRHGRAGTRCSRARRCRRRGTCSAASSSGTRSAGRTACRCCASGRPFAGRAAAAARDDRPMAASPEETVENWLIRNGQTARLREMLWDPLALAALNQPPREAAAPHVRARARRDVRPRPAGRLDRASRPCRSTRCMPSPARDYVEAHGGEVDDQRPRARASSRTAAPSACGRAAAAKSVRAADRVGGALVRARRPVRRRARRRSQRVVSDAARMASYPIVTVNLWLDRPVLATPFVGPARPHHAVGVRSRRRSPDARVVAPVARVERRGADRRL